MLILIFINTCSTLLLSKKLHEEDRDYKKDLHQVKVQRISGHCVPRSTWNINNTSDTLASEAS